MNHIVGIIPAAGRGLRAGLPYPKELAFVSHQDGRILTVIESNLQQLATAGIDEVIIVIRPEKQVIKEYLGDLRFGVQLRYVHQSRLFSREGLTDAVMSAKPIAKTADLCVMLMGDVYFTAPSVVSQLLGKMQAEPSAIAGVSLWQTYEPHRFGIVEGKDGHVIRVVDKPEGLTSGTHWGAVAFRPDFWFHMDYELETFSRALNNAAKEFVTYCLAEGNYLDLGTPKSLIEGILEINR